MATARWVDWFNHRRLYQYCDCRRGFDLDTDDATVWGLKNAVDLPSVSIAKVIQVNLEFGRRT
ncbi:truncated IS6110 transposase [Mycobacterium tuberculosis]|nr:truncated IS6110 transposase [Mycobacterium tuberculosis]